VEAKGLGETLSDRKWVAQVLGYATVAGVEWCVLTDGNEYRFYNATAAVDAEEKLFCSLKLTETSPEQCVAILGLISRDNLQENRLALSWEAHFVDRRVKETIRSMLEGPEKGLIRLIRRRQPKLAPREIVQSLRRLDIRIESPIGPPVVVPNRRSRLGAKDKREKGDKSQAKSPRLRKAVGAVTLGDLIAARVLTAPLELFRKYKGLFLKAQLRADGAVEFQGAVYSSCSTAADMARASVVGRRMNTNGWVFWQYRDERGQVKTLDMARQALLKGKTKPS
jgi:hypothetical protein